MQKSKVTFLILFYTEKAGDAILKTKGEDGIKEKENYAYF